MRIAIATTNFWWGAIFCLALLRFLGFERRNK
jgi:hypothetical protein